MTTKHHGGSKQTPKNKRVTLRCSATLVFCWNAHNRSSKHLVTLKMIQRVFYFSQCSPATSWRAPTRCQFQYDTVEQDVTKSTSSFATWGNELCSVCLLLLLLVVVVPRPRAGVPLVPCRRHSRFCLLSCADAVTAVQSIAPHRSKHGVNCACLVRIWRLLRTHCIHDPWCVD